MEFEMKKPVEVADGVHQGEISRVEYRTEPFAYTDTFIKLKAKDGEDVELKYGAPSNVGTNTKLGKLLLAFEKIEIGATVDPAKILVGKKVSFQTLNETTAKGTYARVVEGSVKPTGELSDGEVKPVVESSEVK